MRTGLIWHEKTMWHDAGNHFGPRSHWIEPASPPENVETKRRIKNLLDVSGLTRQLDVIEPRAASKDDLLLVHTQPYVERIEQISKAGGGNIALKATTHIGEGGFDIACLSAGAAITAVENVVRGKISNAYALSRPPGHHARSDEGMGFCVFNNAAIATRYSQKALGVGRVAIVDIDAHHGNGAQEIFWKDPHVLCISIHQDHGFPLSVGPVEEQGEAAGLGYTINIPLPPGSSEGAYLAAFDRIVGPALDSFQPDLIIVPCGLDAGFMDPTARMMLSSESFRKIIGKLIDIARSHCAGRIVFVHEGGYHIQTVPFHALAVMETLSSIRTEVDDPFLAAVNAACSAPATSLQLDFVAKAEAAMQAHQPLAMALPNG
ncbi:MAG: class II histone deacetylase [Nitratireductor sp.]